MIIGRLGLVGFFGILIPGIYLAATLFTALVSLLAVLGIPVQKSILDPLSTNTALITSSGLLVSYLLGVLMRVIGVHNVDSLSTWYHYQRGKPNSANNSWASEKFPYKESMKVTFDRLGMRGIPLFLEKLNPNYADADNTLFFNYCKLLLEGNCPEVAKLAAQAEAMVRFLSGSALALLISAFVWFLSAVFYLFVAPLYALVSFVCASASILFLWPILARFKLQRRREVQIVWTSIHLLLHGGLQNARNIPPEDLPAAFDPK
jgi:hypothetical protein